MQFVRCIFPVKFKTVVCLLVDSFSPLLSLSQSSNHIFFTLKTLNPTSTFLMAASICKPSNFFRHLTFLFHLTFLLNQSLASQPTIANNSNPTQSCNDLGRLDSPGAKCSYLTSDPSCAPEGYINYLYLFYCISGTHPLLGYLLLTLWLIVLFCLLANTSARYFCSNLEGLSNLFKLPPSIAGVTLLSLGNGAPDVFSAIVSFQSGTDNSDVGLNSVLGGALFVSSVVVGAISLCVSHHGFSVDKSGFIRDICFLLVVLSLLVVILILGEISVWGSVAFASLYAVYAIVVSITLIQSSKNQLKAPLLDNATLSSKESEDNLFGPVSDSGFLLPEKHISDPDKLSVVLSSPGDQKHEISSETCIRYCNGCFYLLSLPLYLPRRLTIPDISKERWSKGFAVTSVVLAPMLLATLWGSKTSSSVIYVCGAISGLSVGTAAFLYTKPESPPESFLFPWLVGGFLMSVVWTYIIAEELVSLLVSLGAILGLSPAVLGLTVLAWGNSIGDLIANVAVARSGGQGGAQVAMSGCYGGPIFNMSVGLGLSLVFASWAVYPSPWAVPRDPTLFWTIGFLIGGLLWALVILPRREMRPDRVLGCGLLAIYLCFLCLRFSVSFGFIHE